MFIKNSLSLTPFQQMLLRHIRHHRAVPVTTLAKELEKKRDKFNLSEHEWQKEIEMQCHLFALRGLIRIDTHTQPLPLYIATPLLLCCRQKSKSSDFPSNPSPLFSFKRISAYLVFSSLVVSGCSALSWQRGSSDLSSGTRPLPRYNAEGWLPPERMEQFSSPGKGAVYRFCTDDCPDPTPKVPRIASAGNTSHGKFASAPTHEYVVAPIPLMAHSAEEVILAQQDAEMEAIVAEAEAYLRDHPPKATMATIKNTLPYQEWADVKTTPITKRSHRLPITEKASYSLLPTEKSRTPEHLPQLKTSPLLKPSATSQSVATPVSVSTTTNSGVVFATNRSNLDEAGKRAVSDLASGAQQAELINLRGYAAPISPADRDEFQQLSIARALSVKRALSEAGIDPAKIRILSAKYQHIDPSNVLAPANRSVIVSYKMPDGQIIKPTVQTTIHRPTLARLAPRTLDSTPPILLEPKEPMVSHRHIENYNGNNLSPRLIFAQGG